MIQSESMERAIEQRGEVCRLFEDQRRWHIEYTSKVRFIALIYFSSDRQRYSAVIQSLSDNHAIVGKKVNCISVSQRYRALGDLSDHLLTKGRMKFITLFFPKGLGGDLISGFYSFCPG